VLRKQKELAKMQNWVDKRVLVSELLGKCSEARMQMVEGVLSDVMRPLHEWPEKEIRKFLGSHVGFNERCSLVYFLSINGMPPHTLVTWAKAQPGWLRTDKSALHMALLLESWSKGVFEGDTGQQLKTAWNMDKKEVMTVYTPNFAFEDVGRAALDHVAGKSFWTDAIAELKAYSRTLPVKRFYDSSMQPPPAKKPRPDKAELMNTWMREQQTA
jgi:hypothetical protein